MKSANIMKLSVEYKCIICYKSIIIIINYTTLIRHGSCSMAIHVRVNHICRTVLALYEPPQVQLVVLYIRT